MALPLVDGERRLIVIPKGAIRPGVPIRICTTGIFGMDSSKEITHVQHAPAETDAVFRVGRDGQRWFVERLD